MADLNDLLNASSDDLKAPVVPEGTWKATLVGAKIIPSKKPDKNGRDYARGVLVVANVREPGEDVLPDEASNVGTSLDGETFEYTTFIYGKSDMRQFMGKLNGLDIDEAATPKDRLKLVQKARVEVMCEFKTEEYEGVKRSKVSKIYKAA